MTDRTTLPGVCSVTFRALDVASVVAAASTGGMRGIEWGGDVHVPPGDVVAAREAARQCADAGIAVPSYGSYLRLTENETWTDAAAVLDTAEALGATNVRVWAGRASPDDAPPDEIAATAERLHRFADAAAARRIAVSLEYHRRTLTETAESTLALLAATRHGNVFSYWQPVPERGEATWHGELALLRPSLSHLHVFHWLDGNERRPLHEGEVVWRRLLAAYAPAERWRGPCYAFLEFVRDDSIEQFLEDAAVLRRILNEGAGVESVQSERS